MPVWLRRIAKLTPAGPEVALMRRRRWLALVHVDLLPEGETWLTRQAMLGVARVPLKGRLETKWTARQRPNVPEWKKP